MAKTKITEQEQTEVIEMIKNYRNLHDRVAETLMNTKAVQEQMAKIQKTLDDMDTQKNALLNAIEDSRTKEKKWVGECIAKYGSGKLNLETMEWTSEEHPSPDGELPVTDIETEEGPKTETPQA